MKMKYEYKRRTGMGNQKRQPGGWRDFFLLRKTVFSLGRLFSMPHSLVLCGLEYTGES